MFRVFNCLTGEHDLRLVMLAGATCLLASLVAISVLRRARAGRGRPRVGWILTAGASTGSGIWATHFIAVLAYDPGIAVAYDLALTALSLIAAILVASAGLGLAMSKSLPHHAPVGGAVVGGGIACMHYLGMSALDMPGRVTWSLDLVLASIVAGMMFGAAALALAQRRETSTATAAAAVLLTLAIVSHHFTAMGAIVIVPDPARGISAASLSPWSLSLAIVAVTAAVLGMSLVGAVAGRRLAERAREVEAIIGHFARARQQLIEQSEERLDEQSQRLDAALQELQRREASFRNLFEGNPVPMWVWDRETLRYLAVNEAAITRYGYSREQFLTMSMLDMRPREDWDALREAAHRKDDEPRTDRTWRHIKADGSVIDVEVYTRPLLHEGRPASLAVIIDVTERKRAQERVAHLVRHDVLTDLPNRAAFNDRLDYKIRRAATTGETFALLSIDLDRLKEINDVYGDAVGDALIHAVAERLNAAAEGAFVARLGGDEFALITPDSVQPARLAAFAERILASMAEEFEITGHRLHVGLSIGVAIHPADGADSTALFANANAALYRAKEEGRGLARFFEPGMDTRLRERRALQQELRCGIERGEILLHYQPQSTIAGEIVGFEALVRWRHPERGLIPPGTFIPIAEESGLIVSLGEWILREAAREAASWPRPLQIAVNLSPIQFQHGDLVATVHEILLSSGLAPGRLELEITEGVLIGDFTRAVSILRRLKAFGVRIAMDDFGTGYSSLSYLQSFPFDKIKIDQTFISNVERNPQSATIVRAMIGLARNLGMPVTAEGVETNDQLGFLAQEACDEVQGFLVGRPGPIENFAETTGKPKVRKRRVAATG